MGASAMALYYPWMHFQNDSWMKLSLLTWEKLIRVRPRYVEDRDGDLVRRIRAESDLLMEITPSPNDLRAVAEAFNNVLKDYRIEVLRRFGIDDAQLYSSYGVNLSDFPSWALNDLRYQQPSTNSYIRIPDRSFTWVYCGPDASRIDFPLKKHLTELRLGRPAPDDAPWFGMKPKLASIYMATLADAVAAHNALVPTTDDPRMHSAVGAIDGLADLLLEEGDRESHEEATGSYVHLALRTVLEPKGLADVPIERLLSFRAHRQDELRAFWAHVSGLADELASASAVEDPFLAQLHIESIYNRQTRPLLRDLQSSLRAYGVDSVAGAMAIKIDLTAASGTALGAAALAGGHLIIGTASVALTLVPYAIRHRRVLRKHRDSSPVAYLLAANRELAGRSLLRSLR